MSTPEMIRMILWWGASYLGPLAAAVVSCVILERVLRNEEAARG